MEGSSHRQLIQRMVTSLKLPYEEKRNSWRAPNSIKVNLTTRHYYYLLEAWSTKAPKRFVLPTFKKVSRVSVSRELESP